MTDFEADYQKLMTGEDRPADELSEWDKELSETTEKTDILIYDYPRRDYFYLTLLNEADPDCLWETAKWVYRYLLFYYEAGPQETRDKINDMLIGCFGWSLQSLLEKAGDADYVAALKEKYGWDEDDPDRRDYEGKKLPWVKEEDRPILLQDLTTPRPERLEDVEEQPGDWNVDKVLRGGK